MWFQSAQIWVNQKAIKCLSETVKAKFEKTFAHLYARANQGRRKFSSSRGRSEILLKLKNAERERRWNYAIQMRESVFEGLFLKYP